MSRLTWAEIIRRYPCKWMLVAETEDDEDGNIGWARVLDHGRSALALLDRTGLALCQLSDDTTMAIAMYAEVAAVQHPGRAALGAQPRRHQLGPARITFSVCPLPGSAKRHSLLRDL